MISHSAAARATNERGIDPERKADPATAMQKIAYYHASMMPPPNEAGPVPVDRKVALAAKGLLETVEQARVRHAASGAKPAHYSPTPPVVAEAAVRAVKSPYD